MEMFTIKIQVVILEVWFIRSTSNTIEKYFLVCKIKELLELMKQFL